MLAAFLSDNAKPAAPSGKPRPEFRGQDTLSRKDAREKDTRDFAATVSDRRHETRTRDARQDADRSKTLDEARDEATGTESAEAANHETPRRKVVIPDLPEKRPATTDETEPGTSVIGTSAKPVADDAVPGHGPDRRSAPVAGTPAALLAANARMTPAGPHGALDATEAVPPPSPDDSGQNLSRPHAALTRPDTPAATPPRAAVEHPADARMNSTSRELPARTPEATTTAVVPAAQVTPAQSSAAAQMAALQPLSRDALGMKDKSDPLLTLDGGTEELRFDLRGTSGSTGSQQSSSVFAPTRAELPRGIAMQLAETVRAMPDRAVDIALSPEELGRVRLSITTTEGGVTLHVLAERPETLELMRRHADQLARDLAGLGFASIDLAFGQGRDPGDRDGDRSSADSRARSDRPADGAAAADPAAAVRNHITLGPNGGLDIRI